LIGIAASGPHSNGYSLIRRLIAETGAGAEMRIGGARLLDLLLEPTRIYVKSILQLLQAADVHAIAHITGGGLTDNIPRVLPQGLGVRLEARAWRRDPIWQWIQHSGAITDAEMHRTFNCGIGMVLLVPPEAADAAIALLGSCGEQATIIGEACPGEGVQFG
jgi:phosphoribosylformylglycinamidine cyclo-ligase